MHPLVRTVTVCLALLAACGGGGSGPAAVTTPDGAQNYGWYIPGQIPSGALVGKIGNDNFTKLGSKSTFTAERSGVLQLAIGMQADYQENQFPGKYTIKVRIQRKQTN